MRDDSSWAPRVTQQVKLRHLENRVATGDAGIELEIERAVLLNALDRRVEAQQAFVDILLRVPNHFSALNEFGSYLTSIGSIAAACRVYSEAVVCHPTNPMGHINLANLLLRGGDLTRAREHYEAALRLDPKHPQAHQGLGAVYSATGDRSNAKVHFQMGFCGNAISYLPYRGANAPIPLLQLVSSGSGNIPSAPFLDDRIFMTTVVVADFFDSSLPLPQHRLIFNTIGDADLCAPALKAADHLIKRTTAPVINKPAAVLKTGRRCNASRLGVLPHVIAPRMLAIPRATLAGSEADAAIGSNGFTYPLLLRSPGFHTGQNFVRVNSPAELATAAAALPGDELLVIEFLDACGQDGNVRKFRVMIIDGQLYPLHLAISQDWKVHYFTSDMAENAIHRSEDAAFLNNMSAVLGAKAMKALERIRNELDLEYGGIDFGLSSSGDVLLFEANATMVVNQPDPDERWDYRRPAVTRILNATRSMLIDRAMEAEELKAG
jgi:TPR repeat